MLCKKNSGVITSNLKYDSEEDFRDFQSLLQEELSAKSNMWVFDFKSKKQILSAFSIL